MHISNQQNLKLKKKKKKKQLAVRLIGWMDVVKLCIDGGLQNHKKKNHTWGAP
jgi:hypothetical protein